METRHAALIDRRAGPSAMAEKPTLSPPSITPGATCQREMPCASPPESVGRAFVHTSFRRRITATRAKEEGIVTADVPPRLPAGQARPIDDASSVQRGAGSWRRSGCARRGPAGLIGFGQFLVSWIRSWLWSERGKQR